MTNPSDLMQMLQQFKANPMQMLMQRKLNVPKSLTNDPSAILNHLMSTGQVTQDQVNRAYQIMQSIKR